MAPITIEEYQRKESAAIAQHCNRLVEAFAPAHFNSFGYPSRVQSDAELYKFVDVMQERRFEHYVEHILKGITEDEHALFTLLTSSVAELCTKRFNRRGCGKSAIAHSLNVLRHIRFLSDNRPVRVFEIGPGCGYLGAALAATGNSYMCYDVTQAFYHYQNLLWYHLFGGRLLDGSLGTISGEKLSALLKETGATAPLIHLPWWEFMKLSEGRVPTVDVVTCNHVLCEMHNASHSYATKIARMMLEGSSGPKLMIFEGWGWHASNRLAGVVSEMYRLGFVLAHQDPAITVMAPRSSLSSGLFQDGAQALDTRGAVWHGGKCYVDESVKNFEHPSSPITQKLTAARLSQTPRQTVSVKTLVSELTTLVGEEGMATDDERFLDFIERPRE